MAFGAARGLAPTPPEKGSFPLDHRAECKRPMRDFLDCLQEHRAAHHACKTLSKAYLECRMQRGLMTEEDLDELGFKHDVQVDEARVAEAAANSKERRGFLGGLTGGKLAGTSEATK